MKYIVMFHEGEEVIFTFPRKFDHDRMYEALEAIRFDTNWRGGWERPFRQGMAISAGFVFGNKCHGASETLGIKSRPDLDTALLRKSLSGN